MLNYSDITVRNFDGGLTDRIIDSGINTFDELSNFRIDKNKNISLREGFELHREGTLTSCHYIRRDYSELIYGIAGNSTFYESEDGTIIPQTLLSSTINNYSTISGFKWHGFEYITISKDGADRSHLFNLYKPLVAVAGTPASYEVNSTQVGCPHMQAPSSVSGTLHTDYVRYALVYTQTLIANQGSGDESTELSFGRPYYTDVIQENGIVTISGITRSSEYNDYDAITNVNIYRTAIGDTSTYYLVGTMVEADQSQATNSFTDTMSEVDLVAQERLYTSDGVAEMAQPPKHSCSCMIGTTAYYGNLETQDNNDGYTRTYTNRPYTIVQSMVGVPSMARISFALEVEDIVTGLTGIGNALIVFTETKVYRFDGIYNNDGTGGYSRRVISDEAGCISHASIVRTGSKAYFCGLTGIYVTDGYQISKISLSAKFDITETYMSRIVDYYGDDQSAPVSLYRDKVVGHYDIGKDCIYWTMCNGSDNASELLTYDVYNNCFSILGGANFTIGAMLVDDDSFVRGDAKTHIYKHSSEYDQDRKTIADNDYINIPFVAKTASIDFGNPSVKKWVQAMTATITTRSKVAIQPVSYNDNGSGGKELKSIVLASVELWRDINTRWRDSSSSWRIPSTRSFRRHFPKRGMRCRYKQLEFKPAPSVIYTTETFGTVSVDYQRDGNGNPYDITSLLVTFDTVDSVWPTDVVDYSIHFDDDNYTAGHSIRSYNGLNGILVDGGGTDIGTGKSFRIIGIRKKQSFVIENINYQFAPLKNEGANHRGSDE